jgi:hypothetical protein
MRTSLAVFVLACALFIATAAHAQAPKGVLPMCQSGEYEQLTRDRIKQLNAWVAGTEEGDVCAGSYPMGE